MEFVAWNDLKHMSDISFYLEAEIYADTVQYIYNNY